MHQKMETRIHPFISLVILTKYRPSHRVPVHTGCRSACMLAMKWSFHAQGHDKIDDISVFICEITTHLTTDLLWNISSALPVKVGTVSQQWNVCDVIVNLIRTATSWRSTTDWRCRRTLAFLLIIFVPLFVSQAASPHQPTTQCKQQESHNGLAVHFQTESD